LKKEEEFIRYWHDIATKRCGKYSSIALYGAGQHTKWLLPWLFAWRVFNKISFIIDDNAFDGQNINDIPVYKPGDLPSVPEAVIISLDSDAEKVVEEKCASAFGGDQCEIIAPYKNMTSMFSHKPPKNGLIFAKDCDSEEYNLFKLDLTDPFFKSDIENGKDLLMACKPGFWQSSTIAESMIWSGWCRAWKQVCGDALFVPVDELLAELERRDNPAVYMSSFHFNYLSLEDSEKLKDVDLFVSVYIHPSMKEKYEKKISYKVDDDTVKSWFDGQKKILKAEPKFIFYNISEKTMPWYQGWIDEGFNWEPISLVAADPEIYYPVPQREKFKDIKMAYVGGYWGEKARAFDFHFRPYEDIFVPFGYSKWPYKNYGGRLSIEEERQLYSSAGLIPLVHAPSGVVVGEITERYFKAATCKAFCIADSNMNLGAMYNEGEILQAKDIEHYHHLVNEYLKGNIDTDYWREKTYKAVMEKNLYKHRVLAIKDALEKYSK
jgi:hypothetical protein